MASQNVRSSFYFFVFFFIMCYHANILEHLPNSIFEFCSNFAVYTIIRYLFLDLCFYKKKTVHIDELQDCCETGLIVFVICAIFCVITCFFFLVYHKMQKMC